ncbi:MAG: glycosyltransferase family 2 protein [Cyclobacteriaceae bacterium]
MKVSVIIVTYNGMRWMDQCLGSLKESTLSPNIIIIDNASDDETVDYIRKSLPQADLIASKNNLGFGKANNIGIKKALKEGCDYVFLLNQDAWVDPDTLENIIKVHQQHPAYGILSPIHLNKEKTDLDTKFAGFIGRNQNTQFLSDVMLRANALKPIYPIDFVNAAAWLISRDCLEKVGGFDPLFPHYGEDNDYVQRAKYHGYQVGFIPTAFIVHDRAGYVKQPDIPRSFPKQYIERLIQLKNIHNSLLRTFVFLLKDDIYFAISSLLDADWEMFSIKVKLIRKLIANYPTLRRSRKVSKTVNTAYLVEEL